MMSIVRGIRGAITVEYDDADEICTATKELVRAIVEENQLRTEDIASCYITVTPDLHAAFPARAVRDFEGWELVPLMCAQEMEVPGAMTHCIRLLLHVNTNKSQAEIRHVYLRGAIALRPDLVQKQA
jgi:chorismate mutase